MRITEITESDKPLILEWLKDPKIIYFCLTEKPNLQLSAYNWAVRNGKDELVGWANLFNVDMDNLKAEFGLVLPNQKSMRVGAFATYEVFKFAFCELGLNRVYVRPLASNLKQEGDQRERGGFVREGIERQSVKRGDIYEDVIVLSMLKSEFESRWL